MDKNSIEMQIESQNSPSVEYMKEAGLVYIPEEEVRAIERAIDKMSQARALLEEIRRSL